MAVAFSVNDIETYIDVEEAEDTGHVTLTIETPDETLTITVDPEDLARALLTASPAFVNEISLVALRAIKSYLGESE